MDTSSWSGLYFVATLLALKLIWHIGIYYFNSFQDGMMHNQEPMKKSTIPT